MKKIEDYLKYYVGCKVQTRYWQGWDKNNIPDGARLQNYDILGNTWDERSHAPIAEVKPILRPLSSMTEEEMQECGNMIYDFSGEPDLNKWKPSDFEIGLAPEQFHWLIQKGFDIFELIDAGLAISNPHLLTPQQVK